MLTDSEHPTRPETPRRSPCSRVCRCANGCCLWRSGWAVRR